MSIMGLPTKTKVVKRQKTINGVKYEVRRKSYYGNFEGWNMYIDGKFIRFHNGFKFENPFDPQEALNFIIEY